MGIDTDIIFGSVIAIIIAVIGYLIRNLISHLRTDIGGIKEQNVQILKNQESAAVDAAVIKNKVETILKTTNSHEEKIEDTSKGVAENSKDIAVLKEWRTNIEDKIK